MKLTDEQMTLVVQGLVPTTYFDQIRSWYTIDGIDHTVYVITANTGYDWSLVTSVTKDDDHQKRFTELVRLTLKLLS